MSTNDDSASRRGRRPEVGSQQWRGQNGQDRQERRYPASARDQAGGDSYFEAGSRDREAMQADPRRASYSGFSRHSYAPPPRQETPPPPPPPQQPTREPPRYYDDPPLRPDGGKLYGDAGHSGFEREAPMPYPSAGRDDLFSREAAPLAYAYEQAPAHSPQAFPYRDAPARHDPALSRESPSAMDDYERNFSARIAAQESQAARFSLGEDAAPQRPQPDQSYMAQGHYSAAGIQSPPQSAYAQEAYDTPGSWGAGLHEGQGAEIHGGLPQNIPHGDELDEDFFADEDELYHEDEPRPAKRGRKKLIAAVLVSAIGVGAGGMYAYKHTKIFGASGGALPVIRADSPPARQAPANPGGKQFPNGEKLIYERLTPDGRTQIASAEPGEPMGSAASPMRNTSSVPPAANSLEDRIEEALKKAQRSGEAPQGGANRGTNGRPDQPTVVRGETYRPDGTRVEPMVSNANGGQLPPPFGNAPVTNSAFTSQVQASPLPAPFRPAAQPPAQAKAAVQPVTHPSAPPQTKVALAAPSAPHASGYYVQLKSSQDEKAANRELQSLSEKFSGALGGTQLITKTVDLGDKGVWFRTLAGPLESKDAAAELCTKLKGAGLPGCLVQKSE